MEKKKVRLSQTALKDLDDIENYIAKDSPVIARKFIGRIFERMEILYLFPEAGSIVPEYDEKSIRELFVGKYRNE